jgi:transcription-repair coupling factor (superfamily II helicase)
MARVDAAPEFIQIQFVQHPPLDAAAVLKLVQKKGWKLTGPTKLRVERVTSELVERATAVRQVLDALVSTVIPTNTVIPANPVIPAKAGIQ